jgi:DNA-directed RNA polymerase specialized sigma24 family protein
MAWSRHRQDEASEALRRQILAAQDGSEVAYRAVLAHAAARARARLAGMPDAEAGVRAVLVLLHEVRHTYGGRRDPGRWIEAVIDSALLRRLRRRTPRDAAA